jgi:GNAT superfamily N-acetyltransferase
VPAPEPFADLAQTWLTGFGRSRQVAVRRAGPVTEVEVGGTERRLELVLVEPDDALVATTLTRVRSSDDVWCTVLTAAPRRRALPAGIVEQLTDEQLMTVGLEGRTPDAPAVGRVELDDDGLRALVRVVDGDRTAAEGQVALVGTDAVLDRIRTADAYRRRGLGTVVMHALEAWAVDRGATRGLLAASVEGQALYARLGWGPAGSMLTLAAARPSDA